MNSSNNAWGHTVAQLANTQRSWPVVSPDEYEKFCYGYLFDALRGYTFGQAFCRKFSINDALLIYTLRDEHSAKQYIEKQRYVR